LVLRRIFTRWRGWGHRPSVVCGGLTTHGCSCAAGPSPAGSGMAGGALGLGPLQRIAPSELGWHRPSALPEDAGMLLGSVSCCRARTAVGCSPWRRGMLGGGMQRSPGDHRHEAKRGRRKPNAAPEEDSPPDTTPAK